MFYRVCWGFSSPLLRELFVNRRYVSIASIVIAFVIIITTWISVEIYTGWLVFRSSGPLATARK